ncbi:unnamed protein product [Ostreobium quekettii]|uniref:Secreted protein n=1 Tax=Ostreobium quekettii TaxID=121088 RepID=A0A8S1JHC4_9CHLO|nr:unnamed protein product [Ostreobium quekettii]
MSSGFTQLVSIVCILDSALLQVPESHRKGWTVSEGKGSKHHIACCHVAVFVQGKGCLHCRKDRLLHCVIEKMNYLVAAEAQTVSVVFIFTVRLGIETGASDREWVLLGPSAGAEQTAMVCAVGRLAEEPRARLGQAEDARECTTALLSGLGGRRC